MCQTGDGLVITQDPGGGHVPLPFRIVSMSEFPVEVPTIDDDDLSGLVGTMEKKCPGKRVTHDRWEGVAVFTSEKDATAGKTPRPQTGAALETIVTFQTRPGFDTGDTLTANAWITMGALASKRRTNDRWCRLPFSSRVALILIHCGQTVRQRHNRRFQ